MDNDKVRLSMQITRDLDNSIDRIAKTSGKSKSEVVRSALAIIKAFHEQKSKPEGAAHIGFVRDSDKLDIEVVNVL